MAENSPFMPSAPQTSEQNESNDVITSLQAVRDFVIKFQSVVQGYIQLFFFILYASIYMTTLILQASSNESQQISEGHECLFPENWDGYSRYSFSATEEIYNWINETIIKEIWDNHGERVVSERNKVLAGLLIHQERINPELCECQDNTKIRQESCTGGSFKEATGTLKFDLQPVLVQGVDYGYSYFLDVKLSEDEVGDRLNYLIEHSFIDNGTKALSLSLVTHNDRINMYTIVIFTITSEIGGVILLKADVSTLNFNYKVVSGGNDLLFAWEILFLIGYISHLLYTAGCLAPILKDAKNWKLIKTYILDVVTLSMTLTSIIIWLYLILVLEKVSVPQEFNIYSSPPVDQSFGDIINQPNNDGFREAVKMIENFHSVNHFYRWYFFLQGINLFMIVVRIIQLTGFQPYLGIIMETFRSVALRLGYFVFIVTILFFTFAVYGNIVFGGRIFQYRNIPRAMISCMRIIQGNSDSLDDLLHLHGLQFIAVISFWIFFVVMMVWVVLNLFIAILSDAYSRAKEAMEFSLHPSDDVKLVMKYYVFRFQTMYENVAWENVFWFNSQLERLDNALLEEFFQYNEQLQENDCDPIAKVKKEWEYSRNALEWKDMESYRTLITNMDGMFKCFPDTYATN